jgi:uncharacterized protein (DUF302 family)
MANPGVLIQASAYSVKETMDRLQAVIASHGGTIYTRINQQEEVRLVGQDMKPLEFLLFGNPKAGGPILAAHPVAALDLTPKVIAWEDAQQQVWVAFNDASYIQTRYSLTAADARLLELKPLLAQVLTA